MDEVVCFECGEHICWMIYSGPTGGHYCDDCVDKVTEELEL